MASVGCKYKSANQIWPENYITIISKYSALIVII